jgi:hypothetical protein
MGARKIIAEAGQRRALIPIKIRQMRVGAEQIVIRI